MCKTILYLKYCFIVCFALTFHGVVAQQDAQYSQYMYNSIYINPATSGLNPKFIETGIIHRQQWLGYSASFDVGGSPTSTMAYVSAPVKFLHGGLGLQLQNDKLGPLNNFSAALSYALHEEIQNGTISFGMQAGIYNMAIDFSTLRPRETGDGLIAGRGNLSQFRPDFSAGFQLTKKKYYVGIAASHLLKPSFDFGGVSATRLNIHTNITGGMNFDLNDEIVLKPSAIIRTDFNSFSTQVSAIASYQNFIHFGLGMRNSLNVDDAIIFAGINVLKDKSLHIGYAFDYVVSGVTAKAPTSHEIILRYNIPMPIPLVSPIIRTPRFRF